MGHVQQWEVGLNWVIIIFSSLGALACLARFLWLAEELWQERRYRRL